MGWFTKGSDKTVGEKKPSREELIRQAKENAKGARERLGDETIQKMAEALREDNKSAGKKAQDQIRTMDKGKIADNLKIMLDDK